MSREVEELIDLASRLDPARLQALIESLPPPLANTLLGWVGVSGVGESIPESPLLQAKELIETFRSRPHLDHLSQVIEKAVADVENGIDRKLIVQMPPRSGKSLLATQVTGSWILSKHPSWNIILTSYSGSLATSWGRQIRRWTTDGKLGAHVRIAADAGAATDWDTISGGSVHSRSIGGALTGHGAKVLIIDDPHKDFIDAHSATSRDNVWNWWLSTASTRLNPPSLVIVIMTRWHEDDLVGRLLSQEYPGDPDDWEVIRFPAIAEENDVLGREPGEPLFSPLIEETKEEALARWAGVRESVGSYTWNALYQQNPSRPEGSTFVMDWWRYWTTDPNLADMLDDGTPDPDGKTILLTEEMLTSGDWVDSWDCTFKGGEGSDYVVGQRWTRIKANRFLIAQQRGRWSFSQTLTAMRAWAERTSPYGHLVHKRIIEEAANGAAIIDTLRNEISGLKPIKSRNSKEARARAVTPEIESGNVFLPHPAEPGHGWVNALLAELREFPTGRHDDQVDALTQALAELRTTGSASIHIPTNTTNRARNIPGLTIPQ